MLIESQLKRLGFGTAALFLLIVAVLINVPQMYLMTVIVAMIPVVGLIVNMFLLKGLTITRAAPSTANQRSRQAVELIVQNNSRIPKFYLRFNDSLPRQIRYGGTQAGSPSFIPILWPGEKAVVRYYIEPVSRGAHAIGPLNVMSTDLLGFTTLRTKFESTAEVLVYPEILPVAPVLMSTGAAVGLREDQDARSKGSGTDFSGVREYRAGDELRRINWKSTARTGALVVTEYSQGFASDITIILDCNRQSYKDTGIGEVSAFEYAVKIAVAFAVTALRRGSHVTLIGCVVDQGAEGVVQELSGMEGISQLLEIMARAEPTSSLTVHDLLAKRPVDDRYEGAAVVITPAEHTDETLRAAMLSTFSRSGVGGLQVFWLNGDAFVEIEKQMIRGAVTRSAFTPSEPGIAHFSTLGQEFQVGPETNLVALLGGMAYGG